MQYDSVVAKEAIRPLVKIVVDMLEEREWGTAEYELLTQILSSFGTYTDGVALEIAADLDGYLK